jgi:hypothetical protein
MIRATVSLTLWHAMACSRLFRGGNQIAALLGGAEPQSDRRAITTSRINAVVNGLVPYLSAVQRSVDHLSEKTAETFKDGAIFKEFQGELNRFTSEVDKVVGKVETRLNDKEFDATALAIESLIGPLTVKGDAVMAECNKLSGKGETATYSPTPSLEFPILCNNQKAPKEIIEWLETEDEDTVDKRVLCDIDQSALSRLQSVINWAGMDSSKVRAAGDATKTSAFRLELKLDNGYKVYKINGSFVGIARDISNDIMSPTGVFIPVISDGFISSLAKIARFVAVQSWGAVTKIPAMLISACDFGLGAIFRKRYTELRDKITVKMDDNLRSVFRVVAGSTLTLGVVIICYQFLSVPIVYKLVTDLGHMIFEYIRVPVDLAAQTGTDVFRFYGNNHAILTFSIKVAVQLVYQLTQAILPKNGRSTRMIKMVLAWVLRTLEFITKVYILVTIGRQAVAEMSRMWTHVSDSLVGESQNITGSSTPPNPSASNENDDVSRADRSPVNNLLASDVSDANEPRTFIFQDHKNCSAILTGEDGINTEAIPDKHIDQDFSKNHELDKNSTKIFMSLIKSVNTFALGGGVPGNSSENTALVFNCLNRTDLSGDQGNTTSGGNTSDGGTESLGAQGNAAAGEGVLDRAARWTTIAFGVLGGYGGLAVGFAAAARSKVRV